MYQLGLDIDQLMWISDIYTKWSLHEVNYWFYGSYNNAIWTNLAF